MTPQRLWARCIAGMEELAAQEVMSRCRPSTIEHRPRSVLFEAEDIINAGRLRTVDDLYLGGIAGDSIGHTRSALRALAAVARAADPAGLARVRRQQSPAPAAIEVTASFTGRRNYNRFDIEDEVGVELAAVLGLPYLSRRGGSPRAGRALSWRVHLEPDVTMIGLRLAERPLHRRGYKQSPVPGTLHPPVAAALAFLAQPAPGALTVDPTCGAGTIAIEAKQLAPGAVVVGSDLSADALLAASANVARARLEVALLRGDAGRLPFADSSVSAVITNPPWGRQTAAAGELGHGGLDALVVEAARVLKADGHLVTLTEQHAPAPDGDQFKTIRSLRLSLRGSPLIAAVLTAT